MRDLTYFGGFRKLTIANGRGQFVRKSSAAFNHDKLPSIAHALQSLVGRNLAAIVTQLAIKRELWFVKCR
jgi:hypothetical protein